MALIGLTLACGDEAEALALRSISGVDEVGQEIRCIVSGAEVRETSEGQACLLSPLITYGGLGFTFNNELDPATVRLRRPDPTDPEELEVYDWKTRTIRIDGPIARWNGDYQVDAQGRGIMTRAVSLSCIDNLADQGIPYSHLDYQEPELNPCNRLDASGTPMKMRVEGQTKAVTGVRTAMGGSCASDDCCDECSWLTTTQVQRYGVDPSGGLRNPNEGIEGYEPAIQCSAGPLDETSAVDKYAVCRDFVASVDRGAEELRWSYAWCEGEASPDCTLVHGVHAVSLENRLRETHPDLRPLGLESLISPCSSTEDCASVHGLPGSECMGTHEETGRTCLADAYADGECHDAVCRPEWVVSCETDAQTLGSDVGFCVDRRFVAEGGGACFLTTDEVENVGLYGPLGPEGAGIPFACDPSGQNCEGQAAGGVPLSMCDWDENEALTSTECCHASVYGPSAVGSSIGGLRCDPFYQANLRPLDVFTRSEDLPGEVQGCRCPTQGYLKDVEPDDPCASALQGCFDPRGALIDERAGEYAVKFIRRPGGIEYDAPSKTVRWIPADTGGVPRASVESCAERAQTLGPRNRHDGWRAHDGELAETFEDFDRAMCSGQEYRVVFNEVATEDNAAVIADVHGDTLEGESVYLFETSQFHVRLGSGAGTNLAEGVSLGFSNKYDVSPENLAKLQVARVSCNGEGATRSCEPVAPSAGCEPGAPVAGGPGCALSAAALEEALASDRCAVPCLSVVVDGQPAGEVLLTVDTEAFGTVLETGETYAVAVPTASSFEAAQADDAVYRSAFWDACGMPLLADETEPVVYDFTAGP